MARGKFNKRGGGKRVDAQSADEIEQRNARLAEFEEERAKRRAEEESDEEGEEGKEGEKEAEAPTATSKKDKKAPEPTPAQVTTEAEHRRNMAKLEAVRKRREVAEKKRKEEEEALKLEEADQKMKAAAIIGDDDDDSDDGKKKKKGKTKTIPKISKIEIKKMKPAVMKEALKERGLDIQGTAKVLTQRLIDYEAAR